MNQPHFTTSCRHGVIPLLLLLALGCEPKSTGQQRPRGSTGSIDAGSPDSTPPVDAPSPDAPPPDAAAAPPDVASPADVAGSEADFGSRHGVARHGPCRSAGQRIAGHPARHAAGYDAPRVGCGDRQATTGVAAFGVALDPAGNVVVGDALAQGANLVLAGYSPTGMQLMRKTIGAQPADLLVNALRVAADGTIVMTGSFKGTSDFGGQSRTAMGAEYDVFVASYTAEGTLKAAHSFGGPGFDDSYGLLIDDPSGDLFVTDTVARSPRKPDGGRRVLGAALAHGNRPLGPGGGGGSVIELMKGGPIDRWRWGNGLSVASSHGRANGMPMWTIPWARAPSSIRSAPIDRAGSWSRVASPAPSAWAVGMCPAGQERPVRHGGRAQFRSGDLGGCPCRQPG